MAITVPIIGQFDSKAFKRFKDEVKDLGEQAVKVGDKLNKAFVGALGGVAGGAILSVKAFADFDQKMVESTAIMGDLTKEMRDQMAVAAREVGRTTKFSANDAAEAFYFLASAGLDAGTSISALPRMAAFAQAGNFDMARATDILTDAQSALGLTSDDTAESMENLSRVSDVFVKAATLANTSVEQLGLAFTSKAGAAVKAAGMDFESAASALMVFADSGVKGEAAGTKLTAVIASLQQGARNNADAFERFGLSVWDSRGNMLSLEEIVNDMEIAFADMSVEQRNAALSQLGLNRQALDGINLLYGNSAAMNDYRNELVEAGGITEEVAGKQMETFNARLGLLKDRLVDVAIGIGERLMPYVERLFDVIEHQIVPAVQVFAEKYLPVLREQFEQLREKLEPLVRMLAEKLFTIITRLVNWMKENTGTVKVFFAVLAGAAVILMLVAVAAKIAALFNPITLIIGAIALLTAGLYHAWQNSETFRDVVTKVFAVVKKVVEVAINFVMGWFDRLRDTIDGFIKIIRGLFRGDLQEIMDGMKTVISNTLGNVIDVFIKLPMQIFDAIAGPLLNLGKDIVGKIVDGIKNVAGNIGGAILGAIPGAGVIGGAVSKVRGILPFAEGGIVTRPVMGLVGEAGPEAVIPLDKAGMLGGGGITINVAGSVIEERDLVERVRVGLVQAQRNGRQVA